MYMEVKRILQMLEDFSKAIVICRASDKFGHVELRSGRRHFEKNAIPDRDGLVAMRAGKRRI